MHMSISMSKLVNHTSESYENQEVEPGSLRVNQEYGAQLVQLVDKNPIALPVVFYLGGIMDPTNNTAVTSHKTLSKSLGISYSAVAQAIKVLKDETLIEAVKTDNDTTTYCLNHDAFSSSEEEQQRNAPIPHIKKAPIPHIKKARRHPTGRP
jgi:hypothetical protein